MRIYRVVELAAVRRAPHTASPAQHQRPISARAFKRAASAHHTNILRVLLAGGIERGIVSPRPWRRKANSSSLL